MTNCRSVLQMVRLQDVVKATLQTFNAAVRLFKKTQSKAKRNATPPSPPPKKNPKPKTPTKQKNPQPTTLAFPGHLTIITCSGSLMLMSVTCAPAVDVVKFLCHARQ